MAARRLETRVRRDAQVAIIDLNGEVDSFAEPAFKAAFAEASLGGPAAILLDFASVGYINSTGIALIVGLIAAARKAGRQLIACGLSDHYVEIFHITRLVEFMPIYPDAAAALDSIKQTI